MIPFLVQSCMELGEPRPSPQGPTHQSCWSSFRAHGLVHPQHLYFFAPGLPLKAWVYLASVRHVGSIRSSCTCFRQSNLQAMTNGTVCRYISFLGGFQRSPQGLQLQLLSVLVDDNWPFTVFLTLLFSFHLPPRRVSWGDLKVLLVFEFLSQGFLLGEHNLKYCAYGD